MKAADDLTKSVVDGKNKKFILLRNLEIANAARIAGLALHSFEASRVGPVKGRKKINKTECMNIAAQLFEEHKQIRCLDESIARYAPTSAISSLYKQIKMYEIFLVLIYQSHFECEFLHAFEKNSDEGELKFNTKAIILALEGQKVRPLFEQYECLAKRLRKLGFKKVGELPLPMIPIEVTTMQIAPNSIVELFKLLK